MLRTQETIDFLFIRRGFPTAFPMQPRLFADHSVTLKGRATRMKVPGPELPQALPVRNQFGGSLTLMHKRGLRPANVGHLLRFSSRFGYPRLQVFPRCSF